MSEFPITAPRSSAGAVQRIRVAAERLFAEQGYDAVSTSAIAELAGVSKATIYHHFASKHDLYLEVLRAGCRESAMLLEDMVQNSGSLAERLAYFSHAHIEVLPRSGIAPEIARDPGKRAAPRPGACGASLGRKFSRLVGILRDGQSRGELRASVDPAMVAMLLVGANVFFFQSRDVLRHLHDVNFAEDTLSYSQKMTDILLHGVLASPDPLRPLEATKQKILKKVAR